MRKEKVIHRRKNYDKEANILKLDCNTELKQIEEDKKQEFIISMNTDRIVIIMKN